MHTIFCFGDSIIYGEYDSECGGWAERFKAFLFNSHLTKGSETFLFNLGIGGETTDGFFLRFENEILPRCDEGRITVIFAYGANDCASFSSEDKSYLVPQERFEDNLNKAVSLIAAKDFNVVFISITPVIDELSARPNYRGRIRSNKIIKDYNAIIERTALKYAVGYIDVFDPFIKADLSKVLCNDGLHPNALGHNIIFQNVTKYFEEKDQI